MKVRFLADASFVAHIVTELICREPHIDFQTADEAGLAKKNGWARTANRCERGKSPNHP